MSEEEWRPVPGYGGIQASSWGRILLPPKTARMPHGGMRAYNPRPVIGVWARTSANAGRMIMNVRDLGSVKVATMVCLAFHGPRPPGLNVLHIDENSRNNRPDNLEWGTQKKNLNAPGFLEYCRGRTGENNPFIKGRRIK